MGQGTENGSQIRQTEGVKPPGANGTLRQEFTLYGLNFLIMGTAPILPLALIFICSCFPLCLILFVDTLCLHHTRYTNHSHSFSCTLFLFFDLRYSPFPSFEASKRGLKREKVLLRIIHNDLRRCLRCHLWHPRRGSVVNRRPSHAPRGRPPEPGRLCR